MYRFLTVLVALLVSDTRYLYRLCNNSSGIAGFDMRYLYSLHNSSGDTTVFVLFLFFLFVRACVCVRACVRASARTRACVFEKNPCNSS